MERLTQRLRTGEVLMAQEYEEKYTTEEWICMLQERLAAYEDTGFMPEDLSATCSPDTLLRVIARAYNVKIGDLREAVLALKEGRYIIMRDAEQEGVARMRELGKADKDGRVVVLPAEDYCWNIRGDLMLGIITANCRAAEKSLEAPDHA